MHFIRQFFSNNDRQIVNNLMHNSPEIRNCSQFVEHELTVWHSQDPAHHPSLALLQPIPRHLIIFL